MCIEILRGPAASTALVIQAFNQDLDRSAPELFGKRLPFLCAEGNQAVGAFLSDGDRHTAAHLCGRRAGALAVGKDMQIAEGESLDQAAGLLKGLVGLAREAGHDVGAQSQERDAELRLDALDTTFDEENNSYSFDYNGTSWSFGNPDFSFSQFRSNLVFRWEYNPGSTLYLVWAHDRSDWEGAYNPVSDIVDYLLRASGNNIFMFKLNFWFSL